MKNKRVLMLLALTAVLSVSMTACSFGGGSDEDSSVVQVTPTPEPTKAAKATPTPAPANAQNTTYTSKNKAVSIKLPDATWANKSDSDDMLSFESPKQGKLLILHGSGEEDMSVAIIPSSQDTASALVKADNLVEGTDFEIQDYKSEEVSGVNVYSYTVHYLTDKSDYKYVVNKYFTDNTTEFYSVAGSVKDEKALAGIKTSVDSFTISGDSVLKAAATGKLQELQQVQLRTALQELQEQRLQVQTQQHPAVHQMEVLQQAQTVLTMVLHRTVHQITVHQTILLMAAVTDLMIMTMVPPMDIMQTEHLWEQMIRTMIQIRQELFTETPMDIRL